MTKATKSQAQSGLQMFLATLASVVWCDIMAALVLNTHVHFAQKQTLAEAPGSDSGLLCAMNGRALTVHAKFSAPLETWWLNYSKQGR